MIFRGTKAVLVQTEPAPSIVCSGCLNKGTTDINVYSKHFHLYWIPVVPIGKIGASVCRNCNHTIEESHMPDDVRAEYNAIKSQAKPKIWQFSGLVIIAVFFVWAFYQSGNANKRRDEYLASPKVGDVYEVKTERSTYTTYKIVGLQGDSLILSPNNFESTKSKGLYKIDKTENYSDTVFMTSKMDIKQMYEKSEIIDVNRE